MPLLRLRHAAAVSAALLLALPASAQGGGDKLPDTAYKLEQVDSPPALLNGGEVGAAIAALYPEPLLNAGITGEVLLKFRVERDGTVDSMSVEVEHASDPRFVQPAWAVVARMRFRPAMLRGRGVPVWVTQPIQFRVEDDDSPAAGGKSPPGPPLDRSTPPDEGTYELSAVTVQPRLQNGGEIARMIEAQYPPALADSLVRGVVTLRFRIMETGLVDPETVTIEHATHAAFAAPAAAAVRRMRFSPALVGRTPVRVWATIPIHFGFEDPDSPPGADFQGTGAGARGGTNTPRP
ncbi:TonB family protein [Longimicrobium sp.]|uniref:TonB family protein n=1 Tax=Longimicrobium sp. TaxID=2029185 RepID=UPI002B58847D|nr:TonB family protein [Longimicrobium sp.]HSU13346.1 TonB family protein [Longimicrobium sp.]